MRNLYPHADRNTPIRKSSRIGIVFRTPSSLRDTAGRPIELIELAKSENERFLSTQNRPFASDVDRFQNPLMKRRSYFANYLKAILGVISDTL